MNLNNLCDDELFVLLKEGLITEDDGKFLLIATPSEVQRRLDILEHNWNAIKKMRELRGKLRRKEELKGELDFRTEAKEILSRRIASLDPNNPDPSAWGTPEDQLDARMQTRGNNGNSGSKTIANEKTADSESSH